MLLKHKSWSLLGLILILFIAWLNLVYLPAGSSRKANLADISSTRNEIMTSQRMIAEAGQIRSRLNKVEAAMQKHLDYLCPTDSLAHFIERIEADMKSYDMIGVSVVPRVPDILSNENITLGEGRLNRVEFDLSAQGRFLQIGKFIEVLQKESFYAGGNRIEIGYSASINPRVRFSMTFTAFLKGREG